MTLDVNNENFKPYVNQQTPHLTCTSIQTTHLINRRLPIISSDVNVFNEAAPLYQEALQKSGYTHRLEYKPSLQKPPTPKHRRHRNKIWVNPPFNKNVRSNIGRSLKNLIDKCFPADHRLRKIFNGYAKHEADNRRK